VPVYILHLDAPLSHARHYVGYSATDDTLTARLEHHRNGTARARFTDVLHERGIGFQLARVFENADKAFERRLKNTNNTKRYCPLCTPRPRPYHPKGLVSHD
jgi:putative endonuclease